MRYGLIGERLSHSYSVEIHKNIGNYEYELCEIPKDRLKDFMNSRDFSAINVTIPYKEAVIPFLDEISETAKKIGAVNTVVNRNGRLYGYNTDFSGMTALINNTGISLNGKKVLILGTGGTSKTAYAVAESMNAREIIFVSRTEKPETVTFSSASSCHGDAEIIINTTPVGMYPATDGLPVSISDFPRLEGVIDAIYNPLRTNLVLDAQKSGIPASGGLYMLSAQAVYAYALFFGKEADPESIDRAYSAVKKSKQDIVLIGMPSSGKTTVGKILSVRLGMPFYDSDEEIIKRIGMPIADFFKKHGEAAFRDSEKEVISEISRSGGNIIATGGGAILNSENVTSLKRNGVLVFLDRSLDRLMPTADRPLSSDLNKLKRLFEERYPIYTAAADITVNSNSTPKEAADSVIKEMML